MTEFNHLNLIATDGKDKPFNPLETTPIVLSIVTGGNRKGINDLGKELSFRKLKTDDKPPSRKKTKQASVKRTYSQRRSQFASEINGTLEVQSQHTIHDHKKKKDIVIQFPDVPGVDEIIDYIQKAKVTPAHELVE